MSAGGGTEGSLALHTVLEEEFARLHRDAPPDTDTGIETVFVAEDISDLPGLAHALLDAIRGEPDGGGGTAWHPRPPAPTATPLHELGRLVVRAQPALREALSAWRIAIETERTAATARLRGEIAARLTQLLGADLEAEPAAALFIARVAAGAGAHNARAGDSRAQRNRRVLEHAFEPYLRTTSDRRLRAIRARIRDERHVALCLSGGGVRSAAFAMGIVQGLARHGLLGRFHYVSTVSGGGYAGSWLTAWMARAGARTVEERLRHARTDKETQEPAPIRHVRAYSRYLNARHGLLSADTWTLVATVLRNVSLIWLVAFPLIATALMVPRIFISGPMTTLLEWQQLGLDPGDVVIGLFGAGTLLAIASTTYLYRHLHAAEGDDPPSPDQHGVESFVQRCLAPLIVSLALLAQAWEMVWSMIRVRSDDPSATAELTRHVWARTLIALDPSKQNYTLTACLAVAAWGALVPLTGWLIGRRERSRHLLEVLLIIVAGGAGGALAVLAADGLFGLLEWKHPPEFFVTFGVPTGLAIFAAASQAFVGVLSYRMRDADRESAARFSAWLLLAAVAWIGTFGLALYGPLFVHGVIRREALAGAGVLAGVVIAILGVTPSTPVGGAGGQSTPTIAQKLRKSVMALLAPAVAASIIVMISIGNAHLLAVACRALDGPDTSTARAATQHRRLWCPEDDPSGRFNVLAIERDSTTGRLIGLPSDSAAAAATRKNRRGQTELFRHRRDAVLTKADYALTPVVLGVMILLAIAGYLLGRLIDTNRFSLHAMYRVRIIRTFLGASKAPCDRAPDPFTGFDETDDLPIGDLLPEPGAAPSPHGRPHDEGDPPLHVVNMSLNVVSGSNLALQDRKAQSFTASPLHAGSANVGYRRTSPGPRPDGAPLYGGTHGISLGTAVAISGAAASPNAGYHSSPVMTFLMTLFNARLGWWLGNPGPAGDSTYHLDAPRMAVGPMLNEMFGRTTDHSRYVYLSDGSHFENLALYEMVLRRCRFIVLSDAGCDPACSYDDLGGAIRKIRIDFGIPIEFDRDIAIYPRSMPEKAAAGEYWAIGRIRYSRVDKDPVRWPDKPDSDYDGILLYIKPAYYGREPRDVYSYAQKIPAFPHESTSDQFFGEAQFESYRVLGSYIVRQLWAKEFAQLPASDGVLPKEALDRWLDQRLR